jgi:hypothetical protein
VGGDGFCPAMIEATKQAQDAEAGSKALFRMGTVGQHGDHQAFRGWADGPGPALQSARVPRGVSPVRTRHVLEICAVPAACIAALVNGDALGAVKDLDH